MNVLDSIWVIPSPSRLIVWSVNRNDFTDIFDSDRESNTDELKWWIGSKIGITTI